MLKACCCRGLQTRPPIKQINCLLHLASAYIINVINYNFEKKELQKRCTNQKQSIIFAA